RLAHFNQHYNLEWGRVSVRNQRSRWGSCSKQGNLNFNYRIVHLPTHLQNYLVVHEMCHLRQHDHSRAFWSLVAETISAYATCRRELRKVLQ
ncbi:MAG TPA: M48 family metallopeptidase, partial [Candidatus Paceibacterota bacterium]